LISLTAVRTTSPLGQSAGTLSLPSSFGAKVVRFLPRASPTSLADRQDEATITSHVSGASQSFFTARSHTPPPHTASPVAQLLPSARGSFDIRTSAGALGRAGEGGAGGGGAGALHAPTSIAAALCTDNRILPRSMRNI
jgi:hypothetical protein